MADGGRGGKGGGGRMGGGGGRGGGGMGGGGFGGGRMGGGGGRLVLLHCHVSLALLYLLSVYHSRFMKFNFR